MSSKVAVAHTEAVKNNITIRIFLDETTKKILVGAFFAHKHKNEFTFRDNFVSELKEYFNCFDINMESVTEVYLLEKKFTKDHL